MHPQAIYLSKDVAGRLALLQCFLCSAAASRLYNAGDNVMSPYAAPQLCRLSLELSLPWAAELPLRELRWDPGNVSVELDFPRATNSASTQSCSKLSFVAVNNINHFILNLYTSLCNSLFQTLVCPILSLLCLYSAVYGTCAFCKPHILYLSKRQ